METRAGALMRGDMLEQPAALERLLGERGSGAREAGRWLRRRRPRLVVFVARGSSDHAAGIGRYLSEIFLGVPACLAAPSVTTLYRARVDLRGAAVIGLSQSGRSPDVVEFLAAARRRGAATVGVTNALDSPLAAAAERAVFLGAGPERGIPATKTFTAQLASLYLMMGSWNKSPRMERAIRSAPELADLSLRSWRKIREETLRRRRLERWVVLGRGMTFPVALEVALKLKEAGGAFAEGASAADFLHGPMAAFRPGACALLLSSGGPGDATLRRVAKSLPVAGNRLWSLSTGADDELSALIPLAILGQIASLELGLSKGLDPDRPKGLRKVTSVL